jgi:RHS repeat-associated protein
MSAIFNRIVASTVIGSLLGSLPAPAFAAAASSSAIQARTAHLDTAGLNLRPAFQAETSRRWDRMADLLRNADNGGNLLKRGQPGIDAIEPADVTRLTRDVLQEADALNQVANDMERQFAQDGLRIANQGNNPELVKRHEAAVTEFRERSRKVQERAFDLAQAQRANSYTAQKTALADMGKLVSGWQSARNFKPIAQQSFEREFKATQSRAPIVDGNELKKALPDTGAPLAKSGQAQPLRAQTKATSQPTPADLAETVDLKLTPQIRQLAQSLNNNPVAIYHWVRNNIEYQPTYGSIQGASLTLLNKRGNAFDTSSLLIALLRAANVPSRYAYGTVQVPADQAMNWLGGVTQPAQIAELMTKGGIPAASVVSGSTITGVRFEHVWVEAFIDFYPSRGSVNRTAELWTPMDAAFKQYAITPPVDLLQAVPFDAQTLANQINASTTRGQHGSVTGMDLNVWDQALESYRTRAVDYLTAAKPGAKFADLMKRKDIVPVDRPILEGAPAYRIIAKGNTYAALPDNLRHVLTLSYYASEADYSLDNAAITHNIPLPEIGISTIGVDYVPATQSDIDAFAQARRDNAEQLSAYLINVVPQVQIEGQVVASGPAVRMGTQQYWKANIRDPLGNLPPAIGANRIVAGSHVVFSVNHAGVTSDMVQRRLDLIPQGVSYPIREGLQQAGMHFWMLRDQYDQLAASMFKGHVVRLPSVGAFMAPLNATYAFGVPRTAHFSGYLTDIKQNVYAAVNNTQQEQMMMFTQIGTTGSLLEAAVWEMLFNLPLATGATAAKVLVAANEQKIPVYLIDQSNVAQIMPLLQLTTDTKQEIQNAVNAGKRVVTPEREVSLGRWQGAGYVIQDPTTGAGVYQIDGGASGGLVVACLIKALLENCEFQKFLAKYINKFKDQIVNQVAKSAFLAPVAGAAFPVVGALAGQHMWFMAFQLAVIDFAVAVASGELESAGQAIAAAMSCNVPSPCGFGAGSGGSGAGAGAGAGAGNGAGSGGPRRGGPLRGNPVLVGTGEKFEVEADYEGAGVYPLVFKRSYLSFNPPNNSRMGKKWRHNYERSIYIPPPTTGVAQDGSPIGGGYVISTDMGGPAPAQLPAISMPPDAVLMMRGDGGYFQFSLRAGNYKASSDIPESLARQADAQGKTTGWTYANADDEVESFDTNGRLLSISDRSGNKQSFSYDTEGRLYKAIDPSGRALTFTYYADGNLETMTDPANGVTRYAYDAEGNLERVTRADFKVRRYHYEQSPKLNLLTGITDESNKRFSTYRYDHRNRVIESKHAIDAEKYTFRYEGELKTIEIDPQGTERTYEFVKTIEEKRFVKVTEPCQSCGSAGASETTYDDQGFLASTRDFNGVLTRYTRDARGLPKTQTDAAGTPVARTRTTEWDTIFRVPKKITEPVTGGERVTEFTLDGQGNVRTKKVTAPVDGVSETRIWTYDYNARGQLTVENGPRTDVTDATTMTYYPNGDLETVTDAAGNVTRYEDYDGHGRARRAVDANGLVTTMSFDTQGRLKTMTAGGELTQYDYDGPGNVEKFTLPDGSFLHFTYNDAQQITSVEDSLGNKIVYTPDGQGNLKKEETRDPSGQLAMTLTRTFDALSRTKERQGSTATLLTKFGYDAQGNLKSVTDPLNHVTTNDYDELNRLKKVTEPQVTGQVTAGSVAYGYDPQDNLTSVTDQRNLTTTYGYSGFNELRRLTSPDTGATGYTYDAAGNVKTMTDARSQSASYTYDASNRLKQVAFSDETVTFNYGDEAGTPSQSTNSKGRLAKIVDATGSTTYGYNSHGRVTSKTQVTSVTAGSVTRNVGYAYNPQGQLATITTPSGQAIEYGYQNNQIVSLKVNGQVVLNGAVYFPFGEIKSWTWANGQSYLRTYDLDGRNQSVTLASQTRTYGFDDASRITSFVDKLGAMTTQSATVGYDELDRLKSAEQTGALAFNQLFGYDLIGNRTSQTIAGTASTLTYATTSNRLAGISGGQTVSFGYDSAGNVTSDGSYTYIYSGRNRLTEVKAGGATVASYKHNAFGERVGKTAGGQTKLFVYDEGGRLLGEYEENGNLIQETVWADDTPVATLRPKVGGGVTVYNVWADHIDTPRAITTSDTAGTTVWTWSSDPFGATLPQESGLAYNLRFPGQYFDSETSTHYNYFRDYNPATGRYQQSDPIGLEAGTNTYVYVAGNPLGGYDPTGLSAVPRPKKRELQDYRKQQQCCGNGASTFTVCVDKRTGRSEFGYSAQGVPKPTPMKKKFPQPSREEWDPGNCGESNAAATLMGKGSRLEDIVCYSVDSKGKRKNPCQNCQVTFGRGPGGSGPFRQ